MLEDHSDIKELIQKEIKKKISFFQEIRLKRQRTFEVKEKVKSALKDLKENKKY